MTNLNLPLLLARLAEEMADVPVYITITRRDENMNATHKAIVPVDRVKPNFDGKGFHICIEESKIKFEEFR